MTKITRIRSTEKVLTTTAENKLGEQVAFRILYYAPNSSCRNLRSTKIQTTTIQTTKNL